MAEVTPGDYHRGVETDIRSALSQRVANAETYAQKRTVGGKDPETVMTFTRGGVAVTVTIRASWVPDEPEFETK